jgi:hypothetical protein
MTVCLSSGADLRHHLLTHITFVLALSGLFVDWEEQLVQVLDLFETMVT